MYGNYQEIIVWVNFNTVIEIVKEIIREGINAPISNTHYNVWCYKEKINKKYPIEIAYLVLLFRSWKKDSLIDPM